MTFYVYGLRLKGDIECRYVGQTGKASPERRLAESINDAKQRVKEARRLHPDGIHCWLANNAENIEAFKIGGVDTREQARAMERTIIALVLRLGHRLLNVSGVPEEQRIGYIPTLYTQEKRAAAKRRAERIQA